MKETYNFTGEEITKLIHDELVRKGKIPTAERYSLTVNFQIDYGKFVGCAAYFGPHIPGLRSL